MFAIASAALAACFLVSGLLANLAAAFGWLSLRDSMWAVCGMCLFMAPLWGAFMAAKGWVWG